MGVGAGRRVRGGEVTQMILEGGHGALDMFDFYARSSAHGGGTGRMRRGSRGMSGEEGEGNTGEEGRSNFPCPNPRLG